MSDVINERPQHPKAPSGGGIVVTTQANRPEGADRIVLLYPLARLKKRRVAGELQRTAAEIERAADPRVTQLVSREAARTADELRQQNGSLAWTTE